MKNKIVLSLIALFLIFSSGAVFTIIYITNMTEEFKYVVELHQVEQFRRSLIINIQNVQSDLYTFNSPYGKDFDSIIVGGTKLEESAKKCTSCHHVPRLNDRIVKVQSLINDYQTALSYFITMSADDAGIDKRKAAAVEIGDRILAQTERMSHSASDILSVETDNIMFDVYHVKEILVTTILVILVFSIMVAVRLIRSVTRPVNALVSATRKITSGEYGTLITYKDKSEFGELADNFNVMSRAVHQGYEKIQQEITDRKLAEEAVKKSEERYMLAARGANDGLWDWDMKLNTIYFSSRWKAMIGHDDNEISDSPEEWLGRIHSDDRLHLEAEMSAHIVGHTPHFKSEHRIKHKDGKYRWVLSRGQAIHDSAENSYRMAGSMTDITERKMAEEQLIFDALHDTLTGLPNRALFMDRLAHAVSRERRNKEYLFAVCFLDMDRFKVLNDSLGHTVGDKLLITISERLEESLRPDDTVARLGGDEFALLLEDLKDRDEALQVAERIQEKLSQPFNLYGQEVFTSTSIGITFSETGYDNPEHLLRDSDIAMYHAKAKGTSCYQIFDKDMYDTAVARLQLETDLRQAVNLNEFNLQYQPIISVETGRITGMEALIRWQHPKKGLISPGDFIPVSEETGLIVKLGEWVIDEACSQLAKWQKQFPSDPPLTISVNIASKQLMPGFVNHIERAIHHSGLTSNSLIIEVTETMIMENAEVVAPMLQQLKKMNVQLHIDDFGTGYSSLSYLHRFPVDVLKIDRSFVSRIGTNGDNLEVIKAITTLAHSLEMHVVAEGVETEEQVSQLKALNCEFMQGYYFSKPLDSKNFEELLQKCHLNLMRYLTHPFDENG